VVYKEEITAESSRSYYKCTVVMICNSGSEGKKEICIHKVIHPKYYKNSNESCTFLFLEELGHHGNSEILCNSAKVSYFWGCLFHIFRGKQIQKWSFCTFKVRIKKLINKKCQSIRILLIIIVLGMFDFLRTANSKFGYLFRKPKSQEGFFVPSVGAVKIYV
jgi:hypothetical protein